MSVRADGVLSQQVYLTPKRVPQVQAGRASSAFVQTRDKYGNNIRVELDPNDPDGPDGIEFELCKVFHFHLKLTEVPLLL